MWICETCKQTFNEPRVVGVEHPSYTLEYITDAPEYTCPHCYGEAVEAARCAGCGEWYPKEAYRELCEVCEAAADEEAARISRVLDEMRTSMIADASHGNAGVFRRLEAAV